MGGGDARGRGEWSRRVRKAGSVRERRDKLGTGRRKYSANLCPAAAHRHSTVHDARQVGSGLRAGKKSTAGKKRTPISLVFTPMASM